MTSGGFRPPITLYLAHPSQQTRQSLGDQVAGTGITVIGESGNGREAIDQIRELVPDVALLAVDLAGIDGAEACAALRGDVPACRVLLVAEHDDELAYAGLLAGAYGCYLLSDPPTTLVKAIRGTMRRESLPTPYWAGRILASYRDLAEADDDRIVPAPRLTTTEADILEQIHQGRTPHQIAEERDTTSHDVRLHAGYAIIKLSRAIADEQLLQGPASSPRR